jgi:BlaI family penicillinase repressor
MDNAHISDGEWKIMKLLWDNAPLTTAQMVSALEPETGWTKTTVFVMLKRLIAKGVVRMDESGKFNTYYPTVSRSSVTLTETENFISRVYDGSIELMFSALTGNKALSAGEIAELRSILDAAEKKIGSDRK